MRMMTVLGMALLLVGCTAGDGAASDTASAAESASPPPSLSVVTPSSSATVSAPPTTAPSATPAFPVDTVAQVVTTDLVLRSAPGTDPASEIYPERLNEPMLVFVLNGPVAADGYDWYQVQPFMDPELAHVHYYPIVWPPMGWVAAGSQQGEPWIAARGMSCPSPDAIETADLAKLHPLEALACFGDRTLRVRARSMICPGHGPRPIYEPIAPAWLGSGTGCALHTADGWTVTGASVPYFAPGVLDAVPGGWMWLSGQFNHPAASTCELDPNVSTGFALQDLQTVLLCRSHFAVASAVPAAAPLD